MDRTPPITIDNIPLEWNQRNSYTVILSAIDYADTEFDTPSGVAATCYTIDGSEPTLLSNRHENVNADYEFFTEIEISQPGEYVIKFFSIDNLGNAEITKTKILKLDNQAPISYYEVNMLADGSDGWYLTNPIISLISADSISGLNKTFYRWNSTNFQEYSVPFQIPNEGIHALQFYSVDNAGNVEVVKTSSFLYDNDHPITQDDTPSTIQKQPVTIHFYTTDNISGIKNTYFTTDGSLPTIDSNSGSSVTISETGSYLIRYFSVDFAGNFEPVKQATVELLIDTEAPHVYISEDIPINGSSGWYRSTPHISLLAIDQSDIKEIKYKRFPSGATTTAKYTSTIDLTQSVNLRDFYKIKIELDQSGVQTEIDVRGSNPQTTTVAEIVNKINSAIGLVVAFETDSSGNEGYGFVTLKSVNAEKEDPTAEVKFIQPSEKDATSIIFGLSDILYPHIFTELVVYVPYTEPFVLLYDGHWQVDFYATDINENVGTVQSKQYKLDSTNSVTTVLVDYLPDGENDWYITNPDISLTISDNQSGVYKTFYQWDNSVTYEYTGSSFKIPSNGLHVLKFYSIDFAGNIESLKSQNFRLDEIAPKTKDNTLHLQGIIFTAVCDNDELRTDDNGIFIGTEYLSPNFLVSIVKTNYKNVKSVLDFYNVTSDRNYHIYDIQPSSDKNLLYCLPIKKNENSLRINQYQIQLLEIVTGDILRSFSDVFKIYNITNNTIYSIDPSGSSKSTGVLKLLGEKPINIGDILQVDYAFNGPVISPSDAFQIDYRYDSSHETNTLNTLDYTFITPLNSLKIHDHSVNIDLLAEDSESGVVKTFYTIYDTDPKDGAFYKSSVDLSGSINLFTKYKIKIEIDNSGLPVEIDLRGSDPSNTTINEIIQKINVAVNQNIAFNDLSFIVLKSLRNPTDISAEIKFLELSEKDATFDVFGLDSKYPHIFKVYSGTDFELNENGNYVIKYYSIDVAGNVENTKTAQYPIIIDKNIPEISITKIPDITENGENGWFKKNYGLKIDVSSDDIETKLNQQASVVSSFLITAGLNDKIDFREQNSVDLTVTITDGIYTENELALEIQNQLNLVGHSVYIVSVVNHKFLIQSDLSAGDNIFELLWNSGVYSTQSIGKTIGFDITSDDTLNNFYSSDYFKIKVQDTFLQSVLMVEDAISHFNFDIIDIDRGLSGFYDEIIIGGIIPNNSYIYKVDFKRFIGINKVSFGLDSTTLTENVIVLGNLDFFVGFDNNRVNYQINFPSTSGQFFLVEGQHLLFAQVFDDNSIEKTGIPQKSSNILQTILKLDTHVPETIDDITFIGWQKGPVTITLSSSDFEPGSGIYATHFSLDGNDPTRLSPKIQDFPNQKIVISNSGTYTFKYFTVDFAGNVELVKTAANLVQVDSDAPETNLETDPLIPDGLNGWFKNDLEINFVATDGALNISSGIKETWYKFQNDLNFTKFVNPIVFSNEADNLISFYSIDNVGNVETIKTAHVKLDKTVPETITNIPVLGYTSNPTVTFSINDNASGGMITYFTIDGSVPTLSSSSGSFITFNSSNIYTIKYFSLDNAGNQESIKTSILRLDLEVPIITNFQPVDCIVTENTDIISFHLEDSLSGVDISSVIFDVDGIEYSQSKNSSYFNVYGTSQDYLIQIFPIKNVLNFEDIEVLSIKNVKDFAGNEANIIEYDFRTLDVTPPRIKEVYPMPNAVDVSTNSNIVAFLYDNQSGVNIESVKILINSVQFSIVTNEILNIKYDGIAQTAVIIIKNNYLRTIIDGVQDLAFSLIDTNFNTIKKLNDYLNSLSTYSSEILDQKYEQNQSKDLLSISDIDIKSEKILKLFIPINNLNFSFIERENGYLVFVTPNFVFQHNSKVNVLISAKDNAENEMIPFKYTFIPSIVASLSVNKRNYLNKTALSFIENIQKNIASNYTRSRSTHFYGHHKSISKELSRVQEDLDHLFLEDMQFSTIRSQFLYEKFGYLLKTSQSPDLSETDYRRLLLSLLGILFKGSLKSSIEEGVSLFLGSQIKIRETVFTEGSDISDQFIFTTDIVLNDSSTSKIDIQALSIQLDHLFSLVKPAHVYNLKRFVFSDMFAFQSGCEQQWLKDSFGNYILNVWGDKIPVIGINGFQKAIKNSSTAICDRFIHSLDSTFIEDVRSNCSNIQEKIQVIINDVSIQATGFNDTFSVLCKPLLKNVNPPEIAEPQDVIVTVNNIQVTVLELDAVNGIIKIDQFPIIGDNVIISYFYNENFVYRQVSFYLNDYSVSGINFIQNQGSILNQQNVNNVIGGFDIDYTLHAHICDQLGGVINFNEHDIVNGNSFIVTDQKSLMVPYSDSDYTLDQNDPDYKLIGLKQRYFDDLIIELVFFDSINEIVDEPLMKIIQEPSIENKIKDILDDETFEIKNFDLINDLSDSLKFDNVTINELDEISEIEEFYVPIIGFPPFIEPKLSYSDTLKIEIFDEDLVNGNFFIMNDSLLTPNQFNVDQDSIGKKSNYIDQFFVS